MIIERIGSNSLVDLAARIQVEHQAVSVALKDSVRHAIAAGELLIEAKAPSMASGYPTCASTAPCPSAPPSFTCAAPATAMPSRQIRNALRI